MIEVIKLLAYPVGFGMFAKVCYMIAVVVFG